MIGPIRRQLAKARQALAAERHATAIMKREHDALVETQARTIDLLRSRNAELEALLIADPETFTDPNKVKQANAVLARAFGNAS